MPMSSWVILPILMIIFGKKFDQKKFWIYWRDWWTVNVSCFDVLLPTKKKGVYIFWGKRKKLIGEKNFFYCCPLSLQTLREKIRKSAVLQLTAAEIDTFSDASPQSPWYTYFKLPNKHIARIIKSHTTYSGKQKHVSISDTQCY